MRRAAPWLLLVTGILLVSSAAAHGFLGWPAIRDGLVQTQASNDLTRAIGIGWLYGSAAMLAFGVLVLQAWRWARAGQPAASGVAGWIGLLYLGFGTWAYVSSGLNPHFFAFIVPGVLLGMGWVGLRDKE